MMKQDSKRVPCPSCGRMAGQLTRKTQGAYVGYERPDGTKLYSCAFCGGPEFEVPPDGKPRTRAGVKGEPPLQHALLRLAEVVGEAASVAEKLDHTDDDAELGRASEGARAWLKKRAPQAGPLIDMVVVGMRDAARRKA